MERKSGEVAVRTHYYFRHSNGGLMVTLDTSQFDFLRSEGWTLESQCNPAEQAAEEPVKRGPGRPRKADEHGAGNN
mgnify:CR=1 FL=1